MRRATAARSTASTVRDMNSTAMSPIDLWSPSDIKQIIGIFTDIDDTLTTDGAITNDALNALSRLSEAGLHVIAITGRPVGWSEPFARSWPIDAIVPENGSVALVPVTNHVGVEKRPAGLRRLYLQDADTRNTNFLRMQQVAQRILREVPGSQLAQDSAGRETDIAIDHSEYAHLSTADISRVLSIMRSEGMSATVSSIHINAWYGEHNKLEGARWIVRELWGRQLDQERERWAYVGDSTNDQLMFKAFSNSIGVANIRRFLPELTHLPHFVTRSERGAGFSEMADLLLQRRTSA